MDTGLRTDVLPAFYARVAAYVCVYRQWYSDDEPTVEVDRMAPPNPSRSETK